MKKKDERDPVGIHDYQKRLQDALKNIASSHLLQEDKTAIQQFSDVLKAQGLSAGRIAKYFCHLKTLSERLELHADSCGSCKQT